MRIVLEIPEDEYRRYIQYYRKWQRAAEELGTIDKQQLTAKGQNLSLDCIGIKSDAESGKTSAI